MAVKPDTMTLCLEMGSDLTYFFPEKTPLDFFSLRLI